MHGLRSTGCWTARPMCALRPPAGVNGRVNMRIVEPGSLSVVPLIRNWIPADAARALLDTALRDARCRGLFSPLAGPAGRPVRFLGGLPDRSAAQAFAGVMEGDYIPKSQFPCSRCLKILADAPQTRRNSLHLSTHIADFFRRDRRKRLKHFCYFCATLIIA